MYYEDIDDIALINKLMESTKNGEILWERISYSTYNQYNYEFELTKKKFLNFRIYHFFIHDENVMNIYITNESGIQHVKNTTSLTLYNLIKLIRDNKFYYIKKQTT